MVVLAKVQWRNDLSTMTFPTTSKEQSVNSVARRLKKYYFLCTRVFWANLRQFFSNLYIGNFRLIFSTKSELCQTEKVCKISRKFPILYNSESWTKSRVSRTKSLQQNSNFFPNGVFGKNNLALCVYISANLRQVWRILSYNRLHSVNTICSLHILQSHWFGHNLNALKI